MRERVYIPFEGLSPEEQWRREKKGRRYRRMADAITYGRTAVGAVVSIGILTGSSLLPKQVAHRSVGLAFSIAAMGMADKADGYFARKSVEYGIPITDQDKKKDPIHDKFFFHAMLGSIALREARDGNYVYAGTLLAAQAVTAIRDHKMNESRANAVEGANVGAIPINKYKTGVQNLAHTIATSPVVESTTGRILAATTYVASAVMGIIGYRQADTIHRTLPASEIS